MWLLVPLNPPRLFDLEAAGSEPTLGPFGCQRPPNAATISAHVRAP